MSSIKFAAVFVTVFCSLGTSSLGAAQTVASPELQKSILGVFPQSAKCGKSVNLKTLSSEKTSGAEIREVWQASTCDTHSQIRYLFRLAPGKNGALEIIGFERAR